ncbi:tail sheath protein [Cereibacter sphaeroides WS8N]|uniref:phage tail sheath subtilisin-like domain-containing protein n=1 Tax=Cereibacter sphaeroides TaxID=1063 RepID=UPI00020B033C|nr:phage tail sheath subtilisin-like domain-containing protein [Cereibacter sphaeroides]EGJ20123.1 tail sheath protein [Cereibacter sphaeroides WS8N]
MPDQFLHGIETVEIDNGIRPIQTVKSSIIGLVGTAPAAPAETFPLDTPVLVTGPRMAAQLGAEGTLKDAYTAAYAQGVSVMIVVRVAEGISAAETLGAVAGDAAEGTGAWALLNAANLTGQTPRILAAPGFTSTPAASPASPVTQALVAVAGRLRAVVIADGPNTTEADALIDRGKYGSDRLYIVDPAVQAWDSTANAHVTRPASAYVAGTLSASDASRGFWWPPSNRVLNGVAGTARPISWAISDPDTEANRLNADEVATIVRKDGFRLWGNRSTATDPLWAFLSVRRTADMIYESVEEALLWAMDRPFSAQLLRDLQDTLQSYLDTLKRRGAILGGTAWIDPELNTEATMKAGKLFLDFDIEPPAPLEHLTLQAHRNGDYYEELVLSVTGNR